MLTRLRVSGFKNLVDVDLRFGPFTCIAGGNGVGKSNLFDALMFLGSLADRPLLDAAMSVRSAGSVGGDVRSIFHRSATAFDEVMSFDAEMIVPQFAADDLGQEAKASITLLRYRLTLRSRVGGRSSSPDLEIIHESLDHISLGKAVSHLAFRHAPTWRKSVVLGRRTTPFISTETKDGQAFVNLHQDGTGGRPRSLLARNLPRTVLSSGSAAESPTVLLAKREMQSWRLLQLEPTALRGADDYNAPTRIAANGAHLPATLARLAHLSRKRREEGPHVSEASSDVEIRVANRLGRLVEGIRSVRVEADDKRELFTVRVTDREGTAHEARSLSDGTLRFLALSVLEQDPSEQGVICLEEPENGIHPARIGAMLKLLTDLAVDPLFPVDENNPLRQIIINTHSPAVVGMVPDDSLVLALTEPVKRQGTTQWVTKFRWLPETWREKVDPKHHAVSRGMLLSYLNPFAPLIEDQDLEHDKARTPRVIERRDLQLMLPLPHSDAS